MRERGARVNVPHAGKVRLHPNQALASSLSTFLYKTLSVLSTSNQLTPFQEIQREVVVIPEPITNKLLISATPRYFDEVMHLIHRIGALLRRTDSP